MRQHVARHVFVDDSGRRLQVTRLIGISIALLMVAYVVVVAVAFSGVSGSEGLGMPGLGDLSSPADQQAADVGPNPIESPAPTAPIGSPEDAPAADAPNQTTSTTAPPASGTSTTTADPGPTVPETTTTTRPGNGNATPNSTIPDHGPPTSRPNKP
jgi:hypothetical protein